VKIEIFKYNNNGNKDRQIKQSPKCKLSPEREIKYNKHVENGNPHNILKRIKDKNDDSRDDDNDSTDSHNKQQSIMNIFIFYIIQYIF
jgi:hypothetical protein